MHLIDFKRITLRINIKNQKLFYNMHKNNKKFLNQNITKTLTIYSFSASNNTKTTMYK